MPIMITFKFKMMTKYCFVEWLFSIVHSLHTSKKIIDPKLIALSNHVDVLVFATSFFCFPFVRFPRSLLKSVKILVSFMCHRSSLLAVWFGVLLSGEVYPNKILVVSRHPVTV